MRRGILLGGGGGGEEVLFAFGRGGGNSGVEGGGEARTGWTCNNRMSMGLDGRSRGVRVERKNRMG